MATAANGSPDAMCPSLVNANADSGTEQLDRPCPVPALPASACDAPGPQASLCSSSHTTDFELTVVIACSPSGNDRNFTTRRTPTRLISIKQPTRSDSVSIDVAGLARVRSVQRTCSQFGDGDSRFAMTSGDLSGASACKDENHPNQTIAPCRMMPRSRSSTSG